MVIGGHDGYQILGDVLLLNVNRGEWSEVRQIMITCLFGTYSQVYVFE